MTDEIRVPDVSTATLAAIAHTLGYRCCSSHLERGEISEPYYRAALVSTIVTLGSAHLMKMDPTDGIRGVQKEIAHNVSVQVGLSSCDDPHHNFIPNNACCGPLWALSEHRDRG